MDAQGFWESLIQATPHHHINISFPPMDAVSLLFPVAVFRLPNRRSFLSLPV